MWKLAIPGAALAATGAVKFSQTLAQAGRQAQLGDFLAFRCGGEAATPLAGMHAADSLMLAGLHCWGCYAMLAGAGLIAVALWQSQSRLPPATRSQPR